jgi:putative transposase
MNRLRLFSDPQAAWMLLDVVAEVQAGAGVTIYAYVVMPDHLHLVASWPPHQRLSRIMRLIKGRFARRWNHRAGLHRSVWQSRFHERALCSEESLARAVDYVHWNPVAAGLVGEPTEFAWSSACPQRETSGRSVRLKT